jgi:hypothetical protein
VTRPSIATRIEITAADETINELRKAIAAGKRSGDIIDLQPVNAQPGEPATDQHMMRKLAYIPLILLRKIDRKFVNTTAQPRPTIANQRCFSTSPPGHYLFRVSGSKHGNRSAAY